LIPRRFYNPARGQFSKKVLNAHKLIHRSLLEGNAKKAREEMVKHVEEVANDLMILQKERDLRVLNLKAKG